MNRQEVERSEEPVSWFIYCGVKAERDALAARLASVKALADKWEQPRGLWRTGPRGLDRRLAAKQLRAALKGEN